jgi:hypothetical protein
MPVVEDRVFFLTQQAIRRQLAAMPNDLYLVRLIHQATRKAVPSERLWTATQLVSPATVRFLRARDREGCNIYLQPYAGNRNAGYILVDLDHARPGVLADMQANGHTPCVVVPGLVHTAIPNRRFRGPIKPALSSYSRFIIGHSN